ncbi:YciI family protein [Chitinophaga alhagiae]|uniref:YciI family protein n=1 Tax=Chitinophaga alhagiae TaxID=2203219 RepID=UPI000E5C3AB8|nr:YciI family protein [Chitinophaga alhagiae]
MRKLFTLLLLLGCACAHAQKDNPQYNKALADSLGADDYGMKMYVLVMLKTGANTTADKKAIDSLFRGHMANINRLVKNGKLVVAGPLGKNDKTYRGIFILNAATLNEAQALLQTDPAVQSGLLDAEMYEWYGSAALPVYLPYAEKVGKKVF